MQEKTKDKVAKMAELMSLLKCEMNGAVVGAMEKKGITHRMNYGVSIPTIRRIASAYYPDDDMARLMYRQQIRELKIASFSIATPESVSESELEFWLKGIDTSDVAENIATILLCKSSILDTLIREHIVGAEDLIKYAVILSLAKNIKLKDGAVDWDVPAAGNAIAADCANTSHLVWRAVSVLTENIYRFVADGRNIVCELVSKIATSNKELSDFLREEFEWKGMDASDNL